MKPSLRRLLAALALTAAAVTVSIAATDTLATPRQDTTWGAPDTVDDTAWGIPPITVPDLPAIPLDTAWG